MRRSQHPKWLALLLAGAVWTGSVGVTAFAAEADSIGSTDIVMDETENGESATDSTQETAEKTEETEISGEDSGTEGNKEETAEDTAEEEAPNASEEAPNVSEEAPNVSEATFNASEEAPAEAEGSNEEVTTEASALEEEKDAEILQEEDSGDTSSQAEAEEEAATELTPETAPLRETKDSPEETAEADAEAEVSEIVETENGAACAQADAAGKVSGLSITFDQTGNIVLAAGGKTTLKAQICFTADSLQTAQTVADSISWTNSSSAVAVLTADTPVITENALSASSGATSQSAVNVTITQNVTISALAEGTAVLGVAAGGVSCSTTVTVNPVPVALGKSTNLIWSNTTVLSWNAVKNTDTYKVMVYFWNGSKKYGKSLTVTGQNSYDLEDCIVALVKSKKSTIKGASYRITATVKAISTNKKYYTNGEAVSSPDLRYLQTTYKDAVSRNGWYLRSGYWYYYDAGKKQTGWVRFQNKKYYLDEEGRMLHDCWVGKYYLKSGGEMAVSEWVDGCKYYVNKKGVRDDNMTLSSRKWVKTSKGWRFKKKDGAYAKSMWIRINGTKYYFDSKGYLKTGWVTVKGKKYYLKKTGDITQGLGIPETGWSKIGKYYYWFDSDGVLAVNQWVDRNQYYVNAKGRRLSWITYENLKNVNTSNRLGHYVCNSSSPPEQSIEGYNEAYKGGNRIMVIDLRFTKDGVPVCAHDDAVAYARCTDGSTPNSRPIVSKLTLKELNQYDYGIYRGSKYKGTGILTLETMAKWIRSHTDTELYIEVKTDKMSSAQIKKTAAILKKYSITDRSSAIFSVTRASDKRARNMHKVAPTLRIGITTSSIGTLAYSQLKSAKGNSNEVFLWCWASTKLKAATVKRLRSLNTQYECGTLDEFDDIIKYYAKGSAYAYNSGIETDGAVFQNLLKAATCHLKAQWVSTANGWKYQLIDQTYVKGKWMKISGKYYYFNKSGLMQTGWLTLGKKLYYLNAKGVRVTGTVRIGGHTYQFDENGVMVRKIK